MPEKEKDMDEETGGIPGRREEGAGNTLKLYKFEYEILEKEIAENAKKANIFKSLIVTVSLAVMVYAVGKELALWELAAVAFTSVIALLLVFAGNVRLAAMNRIFIRRQWIIEEYLSKEFGYRMDVRKKLNEKMKALPRRRSMMSLNKLFGSFIVLYILAWCFLIYAPFRAAAVSFFVDSLLYLTSTVSGAF